MSEKFLSFDAFYMATMMIFKDFIDKGHFFRSFIVWFFIFGRYKKYVQSALIKKHIGVVMILDDGEVKNDRKRSE